MRGLAALLLTMSMPAMAQVSPLPDTVDPRIQTLALPADGVGRLIVLPATGLLLALPDDERVDTMVLGDPAAFSVQADPGATSLAIRALRQNARSTLSVMTSRRAYYFELEATESPLAASRVRLVPLPALTPLDPPAPGVAVASSAPVIETTYKLSGDRSLRPVRVDDDGRRTTIEWAEDQALPATFGIGPTGEEEVADGHMRDGVYVLDRVWSELVFRMDEDRARAKRRVGKTAR